MSAKAKQARDAYAFSLRAAVTLNSHAFVPAIADDALNAALDREPGKPGKAGSRIARLIEDYLARYFAPGSRAAT